MTSYIMRDEGTTETIQATDMADAIEQTEAWLREGSYDARSTTLWLDAEVYPEGDEGAAERVTVAIDPAEPKCSGREHDWQAPHAIVGGDKSNPGVWGNGGGIIASECCMHCGCAKVTDTWASHPGTGRQGLTSVTYEAGRYAEQVEALATEDTDA